MFRQPHLRKKGWKMSTGYVGYSLKINGKFKTVLQHRHIMELILGRKLKKDEYIDHINGVKNDNRVENLRLCSKIQNEHYYWKITEDDYNSVRNNLKNGATYRAAIVGTNIKSHAVAFFLAKREKIR